MWNRDEVEGKADRAKGKIKETTGNLTDDERLRNEGEADQAEGELEESFGRGRRKVGEAVDTIKDAGKKLGR
jgi:uncharacterized protein YjbJ (UPF0337 family)